EPVQADERWVDGRPQVTLRRQFALVPSRAGVLKIPGAQWQWWDVDTDQCATASLPTLELDVTAAAPIATGGAAPGVATASPGSRDAIVPTPAATADHRLWILTTVGFGAACLLTLLRGRHRVPAVPPLAAAAGHRLWILTTVGFGVAWLLTLLWGLHRVPAGAPVTAARTDPARGGAPRRPPADLAGFAKALDHGDFEEIATRLCAL